MQNPETADREAVRTARRVTWVGFWCNILLSAAKIAAGIAGRSGAVIADGIHSLSDFLTDFVILAMVGISRKGVDSRHHYGHGKYETLATLLIALSLLLVGLGILWDGGRKILDALRGLSPGRPGAIALFICALSIAVKEWLYHYTRRAGQRIRSTAVIANAWHHRSDAISSVATLAGVGGAMFLGPRWRILDPLAAVIVALFIIAVALRLVLPSLRELLEESLPEAEEDAVRHAIRTTPGVITYHHLRSRRSGNTIVIDVDLKVNPRITVVEAHAIASQVEQRIARRMGTRTTIVTTHIEPYRDEPLRPDGSCR